MTEYLYLVAIRTKDARGGKEIRAALDVLNKLGFLPSLPVEREEDVPVVIAAVKPYSELEANHHDYLRRFGFTWDDANALVTVAAQTGESDAT